MVSYQYEFANFPKNGLMKLHNFKDVDDNIGALINQIQSLRREGKYGEAAKLERENSDILANRVVGAEWFRTIEEELYNAQAYSKSVQQCIYAETEEPIANENDIWIGGI